MMIGLETGGSMILHAGALAHVDVSFVSAPETWVATGSACLHCKNTDCATTTRSIHIGSNSSSSSSK
jgi:hypothetical protein